MRREREKKRGNKCKNIFEKQNFLSFFRREENPVALSSKFSHVAYKTDVKNFHDFSSNECSYYGKSRLSELVEEIT